MSGTDNVVMLKTRDARVWESLGKYISDTLAQHGSHISVQLRELIVAEAVGALRAISRTPTESFNIELLLPADPEERARTIEIARVGYEAAMKRQHDRDQSVFIGAMIGMLKNMLDATRQS